MARLRRRKKKFKPDVIDTLTFLRKLREAQYRKAEDLKKAQETKTGEADKISGQEKKSENRTGGG